MAIKIFIAGDVVPVNRTVNLFKEKRTQQLFGEMISEIKNSDISIVNLECPIVMGNVKAIEKCGPALKTTSETVEVLKKVGFTHVSLANNHFFDYGQHGVEDTIRTCQLLNILTVGGGRNVKHARRIEYVHIEKKCIAIINACEHEFSIATESHGGSNPLDIIQMDEDLMEARKNADYIVLVLHGGVEHYKYPTPRMKRLFHHFIDMGADAIINHHQHCFSGYEVYNEKPIFYGLGNFCFDTLWSQPMPDWQYGYAVRLLLDKEIGFEIIQYEQCGEQPTIIIREKKEFAKEIANLNSAIRDDYILTQKFNDYVIGKEKDILLNLFPLRNKVFDALFRRGVLGKAYRKTQVFNIKNKLYCEAHNDVLKQYFGILTK